MNESASDCSPPDLEALEAERGFIGHDGLECDEDCAACEFVRQRDQAIKERDEAREALRAAGAELDQVGDAVYTADLFEPWWKALNIIRSALAGVPGGSEEEEKGLDQEGSQRFPLSRGKGEEA